MKTKHPRLLPLLLAVQCGIWMVFGPVLPEMHQAIADHHHVFCFEHNRIEDEAFPSRDSAFAPEAVDEVPENHSVARTHSTSDAGSGLECAFSNFSIHAHAKELRHVLGRSMPEEQVILSMHDVNHQIVNTLDVAPKSSPPVAC
jgi:hypothetical protein